MSIQSKITFHVRHQHAKLGREHDGDFGIPAEAAVDAMVAGASIRDTYATFRDFACGVLDDMKHCKQSDITPLSEAARLRAFAHATLRAAWPESDHSRVLGGLKQALYAEADVDADEYSNIGSALLRLAMYGEEPRRRRSRKEMEDAFGSLESAAKHMHAWPKPWAEQTEHVFDILYLWHIRDGLYGPGEDFYIQVAKDLRLMFVRRRSCQAVPGDLMAYMLGAYLLVHTLVDTGHIFIPHRFCRVRPVWRQLEIALNVRSGS